MRVRRLVGLGAVGALLFAGVQPVVSMADPPPSTGIQQTGPTVPTAKRMGVAEIRQAAFGKPDSRSGVAANAVSPAATSQGSTFTPLSPVRVLDTRNGTGGTTGPVGPQGTITLSLAAQVPASATAVVLNVTGVAPTLSTFITVFPTDGAFPTVSNVNLAAGQIRPNAVTVALGTDRRIDLFNNRGSVHLIADLAGYYSTGAGSKFTALDPVRLLDTRNTGGALGPGGTRTVDFSSRVPASATAVTFNLTGTAPTASTFVTAFPAGQTRPVASNLNLVAGQTTPNLVTVALGAGRKVTLFNNAGSTHLIVDLAGYYASDQGNPFYQLAPVRTFDSRQGAGPLPGGFFWQLPQIPWLPQSATAAVFNLTGTGGTTSTFLTAWPGPSNLPPVVSNLNLAAGETAANLVTVALGPSPDLLLHVGNARGSVHTITDLAGYFAPPPANCGAECSYAWGDNFFAQLGNGTSGGQTPSPGQTSGLSGVVEMTGGVENAYALRNDGSVWAWGSDDFQGLGRGIGFGFSTVPVQVSTGSITTIASGGLSAYGLGTDGLVRAWGDNIDGALGDGTRAFRDSPVVVTGLSNVKAIASGFNTGYALKNDGTVWAWGVNAGGLGNGQFGTGCDTSPVGDGCTATVPVQVHNLTNVVSIAGAWNNAYAITADGKVWAWGFNASGTLGNGTVGGRACFQDPTLPNCVALEPVEITSLSGTGVIKIITGSTTTYALKSDGTVVAWGFNASGTLGNGTTGGQICFTDPTQPNCVAASPVPVSLLTEVEDVAAGRVFAQALKQDGSVWSWGDNTFGQLGSGGSANVPVQSSGVTDASGIGAGGFVGFAIRPS